MLKLSLSVVLALAVGVSTANAATVVDFAGATNGEWATGTATIILAPDGTSFSGSITNTSPYNAHITAFGFDLGDGNLDGYSGSPDPLMIPLTGVNFDFSDGNLGNLPAGFNSVELDFGYLTGPNFNGGNVGEGLDYLETVNFVITGDFTGFTEAEIAAGLLVRFQEVGPTGQLSDVGVVNQTVVPEPASMLLFGTGLAYLARRKLRRDPTAV